MRSGGPAGYSAAPGFRDVLPDEAEALRATTRGIVEEMRRWGYRYLLTPSIERLETLAQGIGADQARRLFKFADSDGGLLALVSERTVPVARVVAGPLRSAPLPLRLCYSGPVLTLGAERFNRRRETHQAGAELIGAGGAVADAEVVALAAGCLDAAGIAGCHLEVGHAEFFQGLLEGLRLPEPERDSIRAALGRRDFVALEGLLDSTPPRSAEHELLLRFPALRGGVEILEAAGHLVRNSRSERALSELTQVWRLLSEQGLVGRVSLDLGAIRDFDYYTGVIFEAYGPGGGRPLALGGRYDRLLGGYGRPAPATGLVVLLDLAAQARTVAAGPPTPWLHAAVAWTAGLAGTAMRLGGSLRQVGLAVVVDTEARTLSGARLWKEGLAAAALVHCGSGGRFRCEVGERTDTGLTFEGALGAVAAGVTGA